MTVFNLGLEKSAQREEINWSLCARVMPTFFKGFTIALNGQSSLLPHERHLHRTPTLSRNLTISSLRLRPTLSGQSFHLLIYPFLRTSFIVRLLLSLISIPEQIRQAHHLHNLCTAFSSLQQDWRITTHIGELPPTPDTATMREATTHCTVKGLFKASLRTHVVCMPLNSHAHFSDHHTTSFTPVVSHFLPE